MVHASTGRNKPASEHLLSEPAIVCGIARAALPDSRIPWEAYADDYSRVRDAIAGAFPAFAGFNEKIKVPGGFYLGNLAAARDWSNVAGGKARFTAAPLPRLEVPAGYLRLMTLRSHDQYNTTVYGMDDRYRGIYNERRVVLMHPLDIEARGLKANAVVDLVGLPVDGTERVADKFRLVEYDIPRGCAAAYFPETNVLVPLSSFADRSQTPLSKFIPVRLRPVA
jgi:anaerobic selenocysteine-containing dehydrogenase